MSRTISALPSRRRCAVLFHLQGLSLEEIAVNLGESVNAVRHLVYRGLDEVKRVISQLPAGASSDGNERTRASRGLELRRT